MITDGDSPIYHSNDKYCAASSCLHCGQAGEKHRPWCVVVNENVLYAYSIILEPAAMIGIDREFLQNVKVAWECV